MHEERKQTGKTVDLPEGVHGQAIAYEDEQSWLAARREGIGGSEASTALGLNPWQSPLELFAIKTGAKDPPDLSGNQRVQWGKRLEDKVAEWYADETGREVIDLGRTTVIWSESVSFMFATIDRLVIDENGKVRILEIKTTSDRFRDEWIEEPPLHVQTQGQHQAEVTGVPLVDYAVLLGGQEARWCETERHEGFAKGLVKGETEFWQKVQEGIPPQADGSDSAREALEALYPEDSGKSIALPGEAMEWDEELRELKEEIKDRQARVQELENRIKQEIGEAAYGVLPGGGRYSFKVSERKGYTVKPTTFRPLRRLKS